MQVKAVAVHSSTLLTHDPRLLVTVSVFPLGPWGSLIPVLLNTVLPRVRPRRSIPVNPGPCALSLATSDKRSHIIYCLFHHRLQYFLLWDVQPLSNKRQQLLS